MTANAPSQPTGHRSRPLTAAWIAVLLVLIGQIAVGVVAMMPGRPSRQPPKQTPSANIADPTVVRPVPKMADSFRLIGIVEPDLVVRVAAEVAGRIEKIGCREGRPCKQGEKMIELNKDLLQAEFDQAKAQSDFDRREVQRLTEIWSGATSPTELDIARTKAEASQAAFDAASARMKRATIAAPVGGILNQLLVEEGEYVSTGQEVAEIVDIRKAKVIVHVPERDIGYVELRDEATVILGLPTNGERTGTVTYIGELADEQTRTTRVEIEVDNEPKLLRSGQIVRVRMTRQVLENVIMIPLRAVIPLEEGYAAYVVEEGVARRRSVMLGFIQITDGLTAGDRLIVEGNRYVAPGQRVNNVNAAESQPCSSPTQP